MALSKIKCDDCDKAYSQQHGLDRHKKKMHKCGDFTTKMAFKCEFCDYSTIYSQSRLNQHFKMVHLKVKNYECTECDHKTGTKTDLSKHILSIHLKRRDFKCDICDKAFSLKKNLVKHSNVVHLGMKHFVCDICDKSFSRNQSLVTHKHRHHKCGDFTFVDVDPLELNKDAIDEDLLHTKPKVKIECD
jgi:hypothetical protein